ncbi:MAG: molybdenum cofactor guanylyltransferase [Methanobrevibacter sp.]|nr:molybdenum cofactor guanylyltransferase [Methanobrevibacter sp.]
MNNKNTHSAIILCGGMSRRMGEDKGSMKINDKPMIIHVLEAISTQINEVILVFNDSERISKYKSLLHNFLITEKDISKNKNSEYSKDKRNIAEYNFDGFNVSLIFVEDEIKDKGPLSGIMTGLKTISSDYALVLPCDSPYINYKFIEYIFSILDKNLAITAINDNIDSIVPFHIENIGTIENIENVGNIENISHIENAEDIKSIKDFENIVSESNGLFYDSIENKKLKKEIVKNSEPLHSIYKKENYDTINNLLKSDEKQVKSFLKTINSYFIPIDNEKIQKINFKNINYKEDLDNY